ncbi:hypothetical protein [Amycolatopsis sp. CA-230715]|uniref:hypothetical protein n=1 Tax=Amycolatopsis sp. CA-230715 TaxID=2745196 RepID=UPI001C00AA6A|nr:hypothetical protein [Amycolatopsis sp. CA-230715]QWF85988.1 hypothetical protein HUW46_09469 [Amycolatopsis sp. CA-230715]
MNQFEYARVDTSGVDLLDEVRDRGAQVGARVLDPEVKLTVDTADGVLVVLGATKVASGARLAATAAGRGRAVLVDGRPGIVAWHENGAPLSVTAFTVDGGRITGMAIVTDPARLASMALPDPA